MKLLGFVYVLHPFQKKPKAGIKAPQHEIDLIKARLNAAEKSHGDSP